MAEDSDEECTTAKPAKEVAAEKPKEEKRRSTSAERDAEAIRCLTRLNVVQRAELKQQRQYEF